LFSSLTSFVVRVFLIVVFAIGLVVFRRGVEGVSTVLAL